MATGEGRGRGNRKYTQLSLGDLLILSKLLNDCFPDFPGDTRKCTLARALSEVVDRANQLGNNARICLAHAVRRKEW